MKTPRYVIALVAINLFLFLIVAARLPAAAQPVSTHRVAALELVDERGRIRSRLSVEPNGEVVLRLMDPEGTIRVKLGANRNGSGLVLLDEATEPAIHLIARRTATPGQPATTSITVRGSDGAGQVIRPQR
jgi:hypothetical protein